MNNFLIALALINLSAILAVVNMVRPHDPEQAPTITHEVVFVEDEKTVEVLNARAAAGWEVVTCRRASSGGLEYGNLGYECVLRRVTPAKAGH